jgi:hypothetical protein
LSHPDSESLRTILENIRDPQMLDSHPWTARPFVKEALTRRPELAKQSPSAQLVAALTDFFATTLPANPPRRGKRLDTRWGEFGLLAAQYFAPLQFGTPVPTSLRDAWGRMDHAILLYVFGRGADSLTPTEIAQYKLVGDELEVAPTSTLSDWHTKGMQKLAEALDVRDQFLAMEKPTPRPHRRFPKAAWILLLLALAALLTWGGFKVRRVYNLATVLRDETYQMRDQLSGSPNVATAKAVGPSLEKIRSDFGALQAEAEPWLWLTRGLGWVPVYGGDIAAAPDLLTMTDSLLASADQSYRALSPMLDVYETESLNPSQMVGLLTDAQPQLQEARASLDLALAARQRLDATRLSPRVRGLLDDLDRMLPLLDDGLTLGLELPLLAGASSEGPKTYLLLAQNEEELRATGGFITAAATLLVQDGKIVSLSFQNSADFDNWEKPYPAAPWQLQQYMNSPVLIFRDANWFTDFRKTASYAEYLYSYANNHSVDGVIAFDQQLLVEMLRVTGPLELEGEDHPIDADNVITFMRAEKTPNRADLDSLNWNNKKFINKITAALLDRILSNGVPPEQLVTMLMKVLNERHLLLQFDDPKLTDLLARRGWDGAPRPANGDFLMVVDTNTGFNKTNVLVTATFAYDVDLTDLSKPRSSLVVSHENKASTQVPCISHPYISDLDLKEFEEKDYPINRCYWDYLRVYTLSDTELLGASVQTVPAEWMIRKGTVPPQVDVLNDKIDGVGGFGTMKVVPGGQSLATSFRFALPVGVLEYQEGAPQVAYRLKIQKQPGTLGVAITVRVHLPNGATIQTVPAGAVVDGQNILIQSALTTDLEFEFIFSNP